MARAFLSLPLAALALMLVPGAAQAQPVDLPIPAATTTIYPPGVKVAKAATGPVYVDRRGRTLYGMDMRTLLRFAPDPALYCDGACTETWEPLLAPAEAKVNIRYPAGFERVLHARLTGGAPADGAPPPADADFVQPQKAPDWTVIAGPQGPQWVYKGWHMVFTRKGEGPHAAAHDGEGDKTWNTLKYVPPVPAITAPGGVAIRFVEGAYALADKDGRLLFTGACKAGCAAWQPLAAGMASLPVGRWAAASSGDAPQWTWRGKPVFVSSDGEPASLPAGAAILRP